MRSFRGWDRFRGWML